MGDGHDLIGVIERAYTLDGSDLDWLAALADATRPLLDRGLGILSYLWSAPAGAGVEVTAVAAPGVPRGIVESVIPAHRLMPPALVDQSFRLWSGCHSSTAAMARLHQRPVATELLAPHGMRDYVSITALVDPGGRGVTIGAPVEAVEPVPGRLRRTWDRVTAHVSAGLRLRLALGAASEPEAVLTPAGRIEHAAGAATEPRARSELRDAAVRMDRARGRLRRSAPEEALDLWRGLVTGRWSLIDRFEASGRRYLVARRNAVGVEDPRALSARERQVVWYASLGHANKLIAYELGVSASSVATHLARAMAKLGITSRVALVALVRSLRTDG